MSTRRKACTIVSLAIALALITPNAAVAGGGGGHRPTTAQVCAKLGEAVAYLESKEASPLRNFLLTYARRAYASYC